MLLASSFTNLFDAPKSISSIFPLVWETSGFILFSLALKYRINCTEAVKCHLANRGVCKERASVHLDFLAPIVTFWFSWGVTVLSPKHSRVRITFRASCANVGWIFPL